MVLDFVINAMAAIIGITAIVGMTTIFIVADYLVKQLKDKHRDEGARAEVSE